MAAVKGILGRMLFVVRMERARWRLPRQGPSVVRQVRRALRAAAFGSLSAEERQWSERVEATRQRLLADQRPLSVVDYGAGSSTAELSAEEMAAGRAKTTTVGDACAVSKPRPWALLLFHLVRQLRPGVCVELGSCVGISASYQAAALRLNGSGRLITLEGAPPLAELSADTLSTLGLDHARVVAGRFQDTLEGVLTEEGPVDFAFIDGHHDEHATLRYFDVIRPHVTPGAVLVFDDIAWSPGMARAWKAIADSPDVEFAVSLGVVGVCIMPGR